MSLSVWRLIEIAKDRDKRGIAGKHWGKTKIATQVSIVMVVYMQLFAIFTFLGIALVRQGSVAAKTIELKNPDPLRLTEKLTAIEADVDTIVIKTSEGWLVSADTYIASGAADQIDAFLAPYPEWGVDESSINNWTFATIPSAQEVLTLHRSKTPHMAEFSKWWRKWQFDSGACDVIKIIGGGSGPFGSWAYPIVNENSRSFRHGFTINPFPNFKGWYLGDLDESRDQKRQTICGETGNVWECLFLKWNHCNLNKVLRKIHDNSQTREAQRSAVNKLLESAVGWSAEATIIDNHVHICKSFVPCYPNISHAPAVKRRLNYTYDHILESFGPQRDSIMSRLMRYTLTQRHTYRLRRLVAKESTQFYAKYPSFPRPLLRHETGQSQGNSSSVDKQLRGTGSASPTCATLQIRHGDKMCDEWLHLHETSAFFFDLDRAIAESVALLPKNSPKSILLITDDYDVFMDAKSPATVTALGSDISIAIAPGSEGKQSTRCLSCRPAGATLKHWNEVPGDNMRCEASARSQKHWGQWEFGVEELSRIIAVEEIGKACTGFVANCNSGFVDALWQDMCSSRADITCIPRTFSFGINCPNDAVTDHFLNRTCKQPCANETICNKIGKGPRVCDPPTPGFPGLESLSRWTPVIRQIGVIP